ncbi:hypothetical protein GC177_03535 [bacterium]|nr:hypothetical protein [bacterium]
MKRLATFAALLCTLAYVNAYAEDTQPTPVDQPKPNPVHEEAKGTQNGTTKHDECIRKYWDNKFAYYQCLNEDKK